jgi:hypothetical protein
MAYVPDEAIIDRRQVSRPAFDLYLFYCKYGGTKKDRTNVKLKTLALLLGIRYNHASTAHRELIKAGWIRREKKETVLIKGRQNPEEKLQEVGTSDGSENSKNLELSGQENSDNLEHLGETTEGKSSKKVEQKVPRTGSSHIKELTSKSNQQFKNNISGVSIAVKVFKIQPPIHTQEIINEAVTKDLDVWERVLTEAKAGMGESQLKSPVYINRSYQWSLKNFRGEIERRDRQGKDKSYESKRKTNNNSNGSDSTKGHSGSGKSGVGAKTAGTLGTGKV